MIFSYKLALPAICSLLIYYLYVKITLYRSISKFQKEHGCSVAKRLPQFERILGLGLLLDLHRTHNAKKHLEFVNRLFESHGRTWTACTFGQTIVMTAEPENIKALLATQFGDFGHNREVMKPLLGNSIFIVGQSGLKSSRV